MRINMIINNIKRYYYQNYTNISLPFPPFSIRYQPDRKGNKVQRDNL